MTTADVLSPFIDVSALTALDKFLLQTANQNGGNGTEQNTAVKVPLSVVRAYFTQNLLSVDENGHLIVNGEDTGEIVTGVTPILRRGTLGIECSTDNGETWITIALFSDFQTSITLASVEDVESIVTNYTPPSSSSSSEL